MWELERLHLTAQPYRILESRYPTTYSADIAIK